MFTYIKNSDINPTEKKIINDKMTITEFEKGDKMMKEIIEFYNKYDEDNRLKSKMHLPEYLITMKYIKST